MKSPLIFALCVMSTVTAVSVQAQTYQWKDKNGRTVISDTPPPTSARSTKIGEAAPVAEPPSGTGKSAELPQTSSDKDLDFKKRQKEAKEKADKDAKEQATAAERREVCDRARRNLAALESSQTLATPDENGQRQLLDNSQREQEIERARKIMTETCNK
jgi:hypothetical protein